MAEMDVSAVEENEIAWYRLGAEEAIGRLEVDPQKGLSGGVCGPLGGAIWITAMNSSI